MLIEYHSKFLSLIRRIKNSADKDRVKKSIRKIIENPQVGKPMRYGRKGTREMYVGSFRFSYVFLREENKIVLLELYHKDQQ